jgi:hypothetical protein
MMSFRLCSDHGNVRDDSFIFLLKMRDSFLLKCSIYERAKNVSLNIYLMLEPFVSTLTFHD